MNPLAMIDMKSKLKASTNTVNLVRKTSENCHEDLISAIIHGEKKAVVKDRIKAVLSLDEAIEGIKKDFK